MPPGTLLAKIPSAILTRRAPGVLQVAVVYVAYLKTLLDRSSAARSKLLSVLKYAAYIVLLLNSGSLPFMWHIRVFWPIITARLRYCALYLKLVFASGKERTRALTAWAEDLSPAGANPFEFSAVYRRWATLDDCDMYGMHLSNSSYAKAFDSARLKAFIKFFPAWGRCGGIMALAATHFHFIREIAPLARYEVRMSIGSWDQKWIYILARFVTVPGRRGASRLSPQSSAPSTPDETPPSSQNGSANHVERAVAAAMSTQNDGAHPVHRVPTVEQDGAVLHCIAVARMCFKQGRITVPPAVVLASEGFTKPNGDGDGIHDDIAKDVRSAYSPSNPPPNWIQSQSLRVPPQGSMSQFTAFLRGQWRDVPEGKRWWEDALGGSVEAKRQANLEVFESLASGMERTRMMR